MSKAQAPNKEISGHIEKAELLERLKAWAGFLSEIDQEEDKSELNQICASLVSPDLLEYQDPEVKLFVACCAADVLRIYAPEAPYADEQLKEIFMLFVEQLRGLEDIEGKSFKRYFYLLENLACVKTFILCMELDAPDIILSLFRTFFQIFNERHVGKVQTFMMDIMITVMQEGDTIPQDVMDIILMHIIQPYKSRKPAAHNLAKELINKSATYLEPNLQKFFNAALMKGIETDSGLHSRVYDLIKELNRVCPSILLAVLPQLQEKLKSSDFNERLEVTRLLADMFSDKGSELATQNKHLWKCFLGRFNDIEAAVRAECISTCKNFILHHLQLSDDCYANLYKRHRDPDEKVRLEAVKVVYAIASEDMTRMTPELFMILQERMLDKKWPIRHQAIMNVARLYKEINSKKDFNKLKDVAWMPNKVLHTYYQNTSQDRLLVERLLLSCLVPVSLGARDRMNILLRTYCLLDLAAIKALNELLKYQQTIRMHLAALLKAIEQGIGEEDRKKLLNQVSMLSKSLPDSKTANSDLKRLSNTLVHDRSLLKAFQTIVTPGVSCQQVARAVSEIMKKLTTKNPIMDTIRALMDRTAPVLADATCMTVLINLVSSLLQAPTEIDDDEEDKFNVFINGKKGLHLILSLAKVYPGQFKSEEVFEQLLVNLKSHDPEVILMDLKILAKTAQSLDRVHPNVASCLQPQLIKIAKEGTPKQAKQAIQVIHSVYKDSPKVLQNLLESMMTMLNPDLENIPSIVKAIGQIAKVAPSNFETFSKDVVRDFIVSQVLTQDNETEEDLPEDDYWCEEEELSKDARVKIESLHVMCNWVSQSPGDKAVISTPVLKLFWALLQQKGDMNGNSEIRLCSMSHLRLHAGLCVLKLASEPSCFDLIPLELFQEVAWLIQDPCPEVKQAMLTKLQKGLTSMKLPLEYVALLAFYATDVGKERRSKARQILLRVIQLRRDYMIMNSTNSERNHTVLPEYALPTLIHLLAYHPNMDTDNTSSLKSSLDVLWWFLEPLMQKNDNFPFLKKLVETVKQAVDAIDPFNDIINERMYAICDLAFGVINCKCSHVKLPAFPGEVKLSKRFFAPPEKLVPNTKTYIPDKFDFNPHRVPVAVEMEVEHPTVKKRMIVAADSPIKKKSKKKFLRKKKIAEIEEVVDQEAEEAEKDTDWIEDIQKEKVPDSEAAAPPSRGRPRRQRKALKKVVAEKVDDLIEEIEEEENVPLKDASKEEAAKNGDIVEDSGDVETPVVETPDVDTANVETPDVEAANEETPDVEAANVETPDVEAANQETADVETTEKTDGAPQDTATTELEGDEKETSKEGKEIAEGEAAPEENEEKTTEDEEKKEDQISEEAPLPEPSTEDQEGASAEQQAELVVEPVRVPAKRGRKKKVRAPEPDSDEQFDVEMLEPETSASEDDPKDKEYEPYVEKETKYYMVPRSHLKENYVKKKQDLFDEPEIPIFKEAKREKEAKVIMKVRSGTMVTKQSRDTIKKNFNSMYDQLIKNFYSPMPYHKRKSSSPERSVKLPEKRLTLVSTRRQKRLGMDKLEVGESPVTLISSTPVSETKNRSDDIRDYLESQPGVKLIKEVNVTPKKSKLNSPKKPVVKSSFYKRIESNEMLVNKEVQKVNKESPKAVLPDGTVKYGRGRPRKGEVRPPKPQKPLLGTGRRGRPRKHPAHPEEQSGFSGETASPLKRKLAVFKAPAEEEEEEEERDEEILLLPVGDEKDSDEEEESGEEDEEEIVLSPKESRKNGASAVSIGRRLAPSSTVAQSSGIRVTAKNPEINLVKAKLGNDKLSLSDKYKDINSDTRKRKFAIKSHPTAKRPLENPPVEESPSSEKENLSNSQESSTEKIPSRRSVDLLDKSQRLIESATMDEEGEPEIKIKRRRTLRYT